MLEILDQVDVLRREVTQRSQSDKAKLGQFMTPTPVARFMASLFSESKLATCNLLDAGAGMGALTAAFLERWSKGIEGGFCFKNVVVKAYEIDPTLRMHFEATLNSYLADLPLRFELIGGDFIKHVAMKCWDHDRSFTHAILNPPYKKINSGSEHRHLLRKSGIETVNLYTAFVALALDQLVPGGEIVAILPRSFCNGPYYRPFRDFVLRRAAITRIHLFKSRNRAFKDDDVLQENIIILLTREGQQTEVTISTSTDERFDDWV
jgi:tRNA1(Val) A37 N6-methylase TrmN6